MKRTCGRRRRRSRRWSTHWSIWTCSPRRVSAGPRSGSGADSRRSGPGSCATPGRRSSPAERRPSGWECVWESVCVQLLTPRWSAAPCPHPGSAPPPFLWRREAGSGWWSERRRAGETQLWNKQEVTSRLSPSSCCPWRRGGRAWAAICCGWVAASRCSTGWWSGSRDRISIRTSRTRLRSSWDWFRIHSGGGTSSRTDSDQLDPIIRGWMEICWSSQGDPQGAPSEKLFSYLSWASFSVTVTMLFINSPNIWWIN